MGMPAQEPSSGRLVAICGIDGSGKTTQSELLAERVRSEGLRLREVSFPRYGQGFFADLIERYLRGDFAARASDVSPYLASLPYALDRWQASGDLHEWLAAGDFVLCNRYVPANMAHQGSKLPDADARRGFFEWVARLEYEALALPRPDLQVLLDVPPQVATGLMTGRSARTQSLESGDIHEQDAGHLEATAQAYRELAALGAGGRWAVVECCAEGAMKPPEQIADLVWAEVCAVLYNREG
jgi:dTMP kinase